MKKIFKRNCMKKVVSLMLIVALSLSGVKPIKSTEVVYAKNKNVERVLEKAKIVKELKNERTENSDTYQLSDGSKELKLYSENIRYNENGKLLTYDTSISGVEESDKKIVENISNDYSEDEIKYVNKKGDAKHFFPSELDGNKRITMIKGNYLMSFVPCLEEKILNVDVSESEIVYSDGSLKYQYISLKNGLKENIILNSRPSVNEFCFKLSGKNVRFQMQNNGEIGVISRKTKKNIAIIAAPNIIDSNGNEDYTHVSYKLDGKDGEQILRIIIDNDYLDDKNTKYPLTVDPTAVWFREKLPTAIVNNVTGRSDDIVSSNLLTVENNYAYDGEKSKRSSRVYIDTTNFIDGTDWLVGNPEISGKYIESSYLYLAEKEASNPPVLVRAKYPLSSWNVNTITWDNQPTISNEVIAETWNQGRDSVNHGLNLTKWVQGIADGTIENNGIVLEAAVEGTKCSYYGTVGYVPQSMCIDIVYRDIEKYDGSIEMSEKFNIQTQKIELSIDDNNELEDDVTVKGYKIFARKDGADKFSSICAGTEIPEKVEIVADDINQMVDYRGCILYSDGKVKASNIITLEKKEEEVQDDNGNMSMEKTFTRNSIDTDGDGLEDGYEIWDFKTKWNETDGNGVYVQDSDGDDIPDGYEVFILGTDPAVANEEDEDSDGDGVTDLLEYQNDTDPHLKDSDFDTNPDGTDGYPRMTSGGIDRSLTAKVEVKIGKYDAVDEYTEDGVTTKIVYNLYNEKLVKSQTVSYDDGTPTENTINFYYRDGRVSTVIKSFDNNTDNNITTTYCYDGNGNTTYVCNENNSYNLEYNDDGQVVSFSTGGFDIMKDVKTIQVNTNEEEVAKLQNGDIVKAYTREVKYGNNQTMIHKIQEKKVAEDDVVSIAKTDEVYLDGSNVKSFEANYNKDDILLNIIDYSTGEQEKCVYSKEDDGTEKSTWNNGYAIEQKKIDGDDDKETDITKYRIKDLWGDNKVFDETIVYDKSEDLSLKTIKNYSNGDKLEKNSNYEEDSELATIYSKKLDKNIISYETNKGTNSITYNVEYNSNKTSYTYVYNKAGNLIRIEQNGVIKIEYEYDGHGRLIREVNRPGYVEYEYYYTKNGNINAYKSYYIDINGKRLASPNQTTYTYSNVWTDRMIQYGNNEIKYDNAGNPLTYVGGQKFSWTRGRLLSTFTDSKGNITKYQYDDADNRILKENDKVRSEYKWDDTKLVYEKTKDKNTGKVYELYYMYDEADECIGFMYGYNDENNNPIMDTVYFEKSMQGDIIGLINSDGKSIAKYTYDAWGNIVYMTISGGNQLAYRLNHFKYRGYYQDDESDMYYLKNRYYSPTTKRFINPDTADNFGYSESVFSYNLYVYCDNNPISYADKNGDWFYNLKALKKYLKSNNITKNQKKELKKLYKYSKKNHTRNMNLLKNYRKKKGYSGNYTYKKFINGQGLSPWNKMWYGNVEGKRTVGNHGCGTIAIYNMFKDINQWESLPDIISIMEINEMNAEEGGTRTEKIRDMLIYYNVRYLSYSYDNYKAQYKGKEARFIMNIVGNDGKWAHLIYVVKKKNEIYVYNAFNETNKTKKYKVLSEYLQESDANVGSMYIIK